MLLDFEKLIKKYNMAISGVIHIGAHYGQEYDAYKKADIKNMQFFEPLSSNYKELIRQVPSNLCHKTALGNYTGTAIMNVEKNNNGQSSSLLDPVLHLIQYPHIEFFMKEVVPITTLDSFNLIGYNLINIDVQGYELEVFKGAKKTLPFVDYIITEVNREEVYKDCARVEQLDEFLSTFNFSRVETTWDGITWGDALYAKNTSV